MENIKKRLQERIDKRIEVLKKVMTKENVNEITYGDKLVSLGALNELIFVMKYLDPSYDLVWENYYSQEEIEKIKMDKLYGSYKSLCGWILE